MRLQPRDDESEEEFYGQPFLKEGVVSIWAGLEGPGENDAEVDVLQDLCGVGYYDLDQGESNCEDFELLPLSELLSPCSFSETYLPAAVAAAERLGIRQARWVVMQFDFEYSPLKMKRPIASDPVFLGAFPYSVLE